MADEVKVYLDHHIQRENLRYRRQEEAFKEHTASRHPTARIIDFMRDEEYVSTLRKPDFQRATWAWSPKECVSLLDSLVKGQVIPSIIMWRSPENALRYILDGGHRVSVVMAWLKDDWGESQADLMENEQQADEVRKAARLVRQLVRDDIGTIEEYEAAAQEINRLTKEGRTPKVEMANQQNGKAFDRGIFYNTLRAGDVFFNVLWVNGDYRTAEQSFLKINKSGKQLSEWETKLIENRDSSFARLVMSIASVDSAPYYWPTAPTELPDGVPQQMVTGILDDIRYVEHTLLSPPFRRPVRTLDQSLLDATPDKRPAYIAEFLTVVRGYRGQTAETEQLLQADQHAEPREIIENGAKLIHDARDTLDHIIGDQEASATANESLELVPLLYFYKSDGQHIRSLLYGLLYWLLQGNSNEVRTRKDIFSVYRGKFEQIFRADKDTIVQGLSRNVGSGTEVTVRTALYFNDLLRLIVNYRGEIDSESFLVDYTNMATESGKAGKSTVQAVRSRIFTPKQRSTAVIDMLLDGLSACQVCGGKIDPTRKVQHDHIQKHRDGGQTIGTNQRVVHPYCNQRRDKIEQLRQLQTGVSLPIFEVIDNPQAPTQLRLFSDEAYR